MMGDAAVLAGKVTDEAIIEISATDGQIKNRNRSSKKVLGGCNRMSYEVKSLK